MRNFRQVRNTCGKRFSASNKQLAERLIDEGRMRPVGRAEVERAKSDGRWNKA